MKNTSLVINNLHAWIEGKEILKGVSFRVRSKEVHVVMGPNGSGKSTLAYVLMGHPFYKLHNNPGKNTGRVNQKSQIQIGRKEISSLTTEERAKAGLFLAFQSPIAIPGVSVLNILRFSYQAIHAKPTKIVRSQIQNPIMRSSWQGGGMSLPEFTSMVMSCAKKLKIDESFLQRSIHDGFSGGEKKKMEMLQALVLRPAFAIFDEIDTGLDVDALKLVARSIQLLRDQGTGVIVITHYNRILQHVTPDFVHILVGGSIVRSGTASLAREIEKTGYETYLNAKSTV